ncbi:MAG: hypothetical protein QM766_11060 [Burkholderiaceae bacterium]
MNAMSPRHHHWQTDLDQPGRHTPARTRLACAIAALFAMTLSLTACGGPEAGAGVSSADTSTPSAGAIGISSKAAATTGAVSTADLSKLTPLQAVQKIYHDLVDWYPGGNNPDSAAVQSWADYASSSFLTSGRTYEQGYALLQAAILADARQWDKSIPATGHPYPRATYNAPTLSWMTETTPTTPDTGSSTTTQRLTPLQAVQKIYHDLVDWYPGGNNPNSDAVQSWASYATSNFFTSGRTYEQAYALLQAAILADARQWDKSIPANGLAYPRATYKAPTLSWMTDSTTGSGGSSNNGSSGNGSSNSGSSTTVQRLTPLQAVQKIYHDLIDWYPGGNNPNSAALQAWASYAASDFLTSDRTYEQGYALLQAAILADARQWDKTIPTTGHPYPRAHYNAPTLAWMTTSVDSDTGGSSGNGSSGNSSSGNGSSGNGSSGNGSSGNGSSGNGSSGSGSSGNGSSGNGSSGNGSSGNGSSDNGSSGNSGVGGKDTTTPPVVKTINSLDTIVNDMKLKNDMVLRGYENMSSGWYVGPGYVMMGNDPRLTNTPSWWKASNPGRASGEYLRAMLPWVVIFDGVGHNASNTRVQIRNFRAYYKSKSSGQWVSLGSSAGVGGAVYGKSSLFGATTAEDNRTNSDGSTEIKPPSDANYAWHGWWGKGRVTIPPTDIAALFVTLQARLVVDDSKRTDDRANARYLVQVGNDYYKDTATSWSFVVPSAMTARSKRVTNDWQAFSATTFSDVGIQEPGGGISEAAFRAAPPPLE